jgi:isopenicillin N synthase-like dioxygenase
LIADEHAKGSLQVRLPATGEWISADPIEGCFVCNIGDMMQVLLFLEEGLTAGVDK